MAKHKKRETHTILVYIAWGLAFIAFSMALMSAGYYLGYDKAKKESLAKMREQEKKQVEMLKKIEEASTAQVPPPQSVNEKLKEVLAKESKIVEKASTNLESANHEYDVEPPLREDREVKKIAAKPKLAIIIDDVSTRAHVNAIHSLGMAITMSFLPPSSQRPQSADLAAKESFYMVHLPMEAQNFTKEEPFTLRVDDSQERISERIVELKKLFPKMEYINNHTGSKFTSDERAVNHLFFALKHHGIHFIDSRTTAQTKVPKVAKNYGLEYVARDVFLDHENDKEYIKKQIKKAVSVAKTHGSAIAIGHPHANTILALNESKKILKDVELVYVNSIY
ncbi:MAG: divergent polysaccharide deacetylase family protein [Epsilonproteobacteria bacterium]|nr:divergent polysaccharide deacetylase family protein [Campylobacterota bacterium]